MKKFFVYLIYSKKGDCYYRGFSEDPFRRLEQHKEGKSSYTSKFKDWKIIYIESFESKKEALIREKVLKKYSKDQIQRLMNSSKNEFNIVE